MARGEAEKGVIVCGSGVGVSIVANKVDGIRAVNAHDAAEAEMSRRHNDANVVTLSGARLGPEDAKPIVETFLATDFDGGRHARRVGRSPRWSAASSSSQGCRRAPAGNATRRKLTPAAARFANRGSRKTRHSADFPADPEPASLVPSLSRPRTISQKDGCFHEHRFRRAVLAPACPRSIPLLRRRSAAS